MKRVILKKIIESDLHAWLQILTQKKEGIQKNVILMKAIEQYL